jgi:prepilin-type processing-associated H-X9-DG protein
MKRVLFCRRRGLTLADLLVVAVLIPLLGISFLACSRRIHDERAGPIHCASNLRQIGQAILLYANENRGAYPRTTFVGGDVVRPVWGTGAACTQPFSSAGPQPNDVTAALFLLLRTQEITSEVFTCPATAQERWDFGGDDKTALNWSNWEGAHGIKLHLSYSLANPYPDDAAIKSGYKLTTSITAEFAVAADMNPGVVHGSNVLTVMSTATTSQMKAGNSHNHDEDGQNVLYGDGHVEFQQTPFCGIKRDNIYARRASTEGLSSSDVINSPLDADDSVLLPCEE